MTRIEGLGETPPEAKDFKAEGEPNLSDVEPTEDELQFFRKMTNEQWDARQTEYRRAAAATEKETEEELKQLEQQRREKWERRTVVLQALHLTGNIVEDARAFFQAAHIDPNTLEGRYSQAFRTGDRTVMLEYFRDIGKSAGTAPAGMSSAAQEYFRTFNETVKQVIKAAEARSAPA